MKTGTLLTLLNKDVHVHVIGISSFDKFISSDASGSKIAQISQKYNIRNRFSFNDFDSFKVKNKFSFEDRKCRKFSRKT